MNKKKNIFFVSVAITLFSVFIFSGCLKPKTKINYRMKLEVWGVFDDSEAFDAINGEYIRANKQLTEIKYRKISANSADFEKELLDAISTGKGPDIIFFHNSWLLKHRNKIVPLPQSENQLANFRQTFVDVAENDFVLDNQIYAMPLYCDTLALYYNKNLFNQAGIATPPETWDEIKNKVPLLTKINDFGNIEQSAIALGRSKEPGGINRANDILYLLMMQKGLEFLNENKSAVSFGNKNASQEALDFYIQFALGGSPVYTWNSSMDYSTDSFRYGKTAMMINYSYWADSFKKSDPKFNFGVASMPQFDLNNRKDFANYWGLAVINNKDISLNIVDQNTKTNFTNEDRINEAWKYIKYVTAGVSSTASPEKETAGVSWGVRTTDTTNDPTEKYLELTKKPSARRDLVEKQMGDADLKIFAEQALTAQSWLQPDNNETDAIFMEMIDDVVSGKFSSYEALKTAESRVNNLFKNTRSGWER